jgi:hypothetical protein
MNTVFPMTPIDVAVLGTHEFLFDLTSAHPPSLDEICQRFATDTNRAVVWFIRFHALKAWRTARTRNPSWNAPSWKGPDICTVAAWFDLNDRWEFDHDAFCRAVEQAVHERSTRN